MRFPRVIARINRVATNRIANLFAGRIPPLVLVDHVGRKSGTTYQTPVMAFRDGESFSIALTYGPDADWVQNVLAAEGCVLVDRGERVWCTNARHVVSSPRDLPLPWLIKNVLTVIRVRDFLLLDTEN